MRVPWLLAALAVPPSPPNVVPQQQTSVAVTTSTVAPTSRLQDGISLWLAAAPPPSQADINLLRSAFKEFYGVEQDLPKALDLLTQAIDKWQDQLADERAGLYRVRGDCYLLLKDAPKAQADYTTAIDLLETPEGKQNADPAELPLALLGRARATKSTVLNDKQAAQAASDYERALKLTSREEWDTDDELLEDGATRNPYAAWEWGSVLRRVNFDQAARAHLLAANAFETIGDKARSVISRLDAGIDLAAAAADKDVSQAVTLLRSAIKQTKGVESNDVTLLRHVIAKEGEGRMALAALLWNSGQRPEAEAVLGETCLRLDQLQASDALRSPKPSTEESQAPLKYSIDDDVAPIDMTCNKFKNAQFLTEQLGWPENLQRKVIKLETLR